MIPVRTVDVSTEPNDAKPVIASRAGKAWQDLIGGIRKTWLWTALALQDIRLRYRGSVLGPFWLTVSTAITVGAMGFLYAKLFGADPAVYVPYLTVGLVAWQFVSFLINE